MCSPTDSNIFAFSTSDYRVNFFDIRANEVILSFEGATKIKWNPSESIYFAASSATQIQVFDLRNDAPFHVISEPIQSFDWTISNEICYSKAKELVHLYNIDKKTFKTSKKGTSWIQHYQKDILVGGDHNKLCFFDVNTLNIMNTIEFKDDVLLFANRKENQFVTWSSEINLYTFEMNQYLDDEIEYNEDYRGLEVTKKDFSDLVPSPVTSGGRIGFNGELAYHTAGLDVEARSLKDFHISASKKDTYHDLNYFSNFFIEQHQEENVKTVKADVTLYDLKSIVGLDQILARDLKFDAKHNLAVLEKREMVKDVKLWTLLHILQQNNVKCEIFDKTLDGM